MDDWKQDRKKTSDLSRREVLTGASAGIAASVAGFLLAGADPAAAEPTLPEATMVPASPAAEDAANNVSIDPEHIFVPKPVKNPITVVTEPVMGSNIPLQLTYVETVDGMYAPVACANLRAMVRSPLLCSRT